MYPYLYPGTFEVPCPSLVLITVEVVKSTRLVIRRPHQSLLYDQNGHLPGGIKMLNFDGHTLSCIIVSSNTRVVSDEGGLK